MTAADVANAPAALPMLMLASIRPAAAFLAAPVFGLPQVPVVLRFILAVAIGIPASRIALVPLDDVMSVGGVLIIAGEVVIGLALGFAMKTAFAAAAIAGELIGNAMGLGFASTIDPANGHGTPAISQILTIVATLLFLSIDGHLAFIAVIIDSFRTLPIGGALLSPHAVGAIVTTGSAMFAAAIMLALPVVTGVILIQLIMALLARSAPALNLFAVGLPAALLGGLILFAFSLPIMGQGMIRTITASIGDTARLSAQ